ncbi:hypothetical protein [Chryseobacterium paridis]|uniref:Uncharacterized protein n=1 Tax=Chryseobacterium paridis TaxID=2800328 RepID=A0ABS1FVD7_9FLAO|nr:hypothetical protein [Chryseobacterium paridis]MBK1896410.1 hypothetical protein [Chryseobacterium paridis]
MKTLITIFSLLFFSFSYGQSVSKTKPTTLNAIAKFISHENGEMIYISKFSIIKDFSNNAFADTVFVYDSKEIPLDFDTVLLTVNKYGGENSEGNIYFSSPGHDANYGIHPIRDNQISISKNENSEINEWALKGQIRKITVLQYEQFDQTKNKPINTKNYKSITTVNYNHAGNLDSLKILYKTKTSSKFMETNISYNYTNVERTGIVIENKKDTISITRKKWLTNQLYIEEYFDNKNNLFKTTWTFVDSNNKITHQRTEEKHTKSGTKIRPFDIYYTFNENNSLEKITTKFQGIENETFVDKNIDLLFDNNGNPTKSIKFENNIQYLIIKEYEYY